MAQTFDVLIIGGGINGTSIARDAAGRGLAVMLCEKSDLASGTSSASTKLIHGGLRYLEHYEFRLVRESLMEREVMLRSAPHLVEPMFFVLPHHRGLRSAWLLRLGLFLYDHLRGKSVLPKASSVNLRRDPVGKVLKESFRKGFKYIDCWVDDARLVALNALDASERGATICTRTRFVHAERGEDRWQVTLESAAGEHHAVSAKAIVNAAGPWVGEALSGFGGIQTNKRVRLVKGSHIIVDQLFDTSDSYIFQNADGRIIFAIPYQSDYTLIGTTDIPYEGSLEDIRISQDEINYLCSSASEYFKAPISPEQVVHTYSGVRSLFDDGEENASEITRDYVLDLDSENGAAPLLSIFGGKITTCRKLAEHALDELAKVIQINKGNWTEHEPLPGGDIPNADFATFRERLIQHYAWLDAEILHRLGRAYGTRVDDILDGATSVESLGIDFGGGLYEREVRYLIEKEWARSGDDILFRRSKLGLHLSADKCEHLRQWVSGFVAGSKPEV